MGAFANFYLYLNGVSVPFLGYTISPELLGWRSLVNAIVFLLFFYYGYVRK